MPNEQLVLSALSRLRLLAGDSQDWADYLRTIVDSRIESLSGKAPMGLVPNMNSFLNRLGSVRTTVELLDAPAEIVERPEGIVDLGILEWLLRPALPIRRNGHVIVPEDGPWRYLDSEIISREEKAVCRLDLATDGFDPFQIGSGFGVEATDSDYIGIMTNCHVLDEAIKCGWPDSRELELRCDFGRYSTELPGRAIIMSDHYFSHPTYDLVVFFVERDLLFEDLDEMLEITTQAPDFDSVKVGVIGHPSFNSAKDQFATSFGFGEQFGIKRLSPGYIRATEQRAWRGHETTFLLHDASTLSGSSGSCVVDLDKGSAIGLHVGGWPAIGRSVSGSSSDIASNMFESNGAIPLWLLTEELHACGVNVETYSNAERNHQQ